MELLLLGIIIGCVITNIIFHVRYKKVGIFKIDHSNPKKDVYRMEFDDIDELSTKTVALIKIDNNADLSQ